MIPPPKLDDREFDDLVAEALRLIPRYAPEWTHHNPADPGITLIELAAWMTDLILFRLNRVPEKNYVAFLNLLGIKLKPPQAARSLLRFKLVEGATRQVVPAGTQVATPQATDEETITFETARDLVVTSVELDRCFSYDHDSYADNSQFVLGEPAREGGFETFGGASRVERFLYLSDPRLAGCGDSSVLRVFLGCPEHGGRDLARLLEWEYWNGDRWRELAPAPIEVDRGEVCFLGPLPFEPTSVNDVEGLWLRGRLAEVAGPADTEIDTVRVRIEVAGEGVPPDKAFVNLDNDAYIFVDLGKNLYPFGKEPKVDCIFYVACDDLTRTPEAEVSLEVTLAEAHVIPAPQPSDDLTLSWEYFDGKRWRPLGRSGPRGVRPGAADYGFHDPTLAFTKSGVVTFRRPADMESCEIAGEAARWIRVRVEQGDYGAAGSYTLDSEKWVFRDDRPLRPPVVRSLSFRTREEYRDVRHALTFNDFQYADVTEDARTDYTIFQPFGPVRDESPALYLGFNDRLPNDNLSLYFHMAEDLGPAAADDDSAVKTPELARYEEERLATWEAEQRVVWEYFDGKDWAPLSVNDNTGGFVSSGFVDFLGPDDWQRCMKFTEERFWLRARLELGGYVKPPRILRVFTNVVDARHQSAIEEEILGSSDASPLQSFHLLHGPVLEDEEIEVRERQRPADEELEELGEGAIRAAEPGGTTEEVWVRWRRVESFFQSGPRSRHYTIDYQTGDVTFGDGRKGMIPPEGRNNVVARHYRVGGGSGGNVNAGTITALARAIAYIDSVDNPLPAAGGADRETVEEAKERAPFTIKSRDRAVTAEDFEMLALRASTSLARARCVPDRSHRGAVSLVVVPKSDTGPQDLTRRLMPSNEILRFVKRYLDERRLVGTVLHVIKPRYRDLSLKVTLLRRTIGTSDRLRRSIEERLRRFLHPLVGGRDARGWPFGRSVLKTDLIHLVEEVPGVEGVDDIDVLDEQRNVHVEQIRVEADELPFLVHVHVVEKVREEIM